MAKNNINSRSIGPCADVKAGVDISKVLRGHFSNTKVAQEFIDKGLSVIEDELPKTIRYADFGGGQGFLTKLITEWLISKGHKVDTYVIDANSEYLKIAEQEELKVQQCNLEECDFKEADLITMRSVNHYNSADTQFEIIKNAFKSLKENCYLLSQISSGSDENCRLRSEILNLKSFIKIKDKGEYYWAPVKEYIGFLEKAGFSNIEVVGNAPGNHWSPEEQWVRFCGKEQKEIESGGDADKTADIKKQRKTFLEDAYALINSYVDKYGQEKLDVEFAKDGVATINYLHPIVKSQKIK